MKLEPASDWFAFAGAAGQWNISHGALMGCLADTLLSWIREESNPCAVVRNEMQRGGRSHENTGEICTRAPERQIFKNDLFI